MKKYYCLLLILSFVLILGCGKEKKPEGMPDIHPCIIKVIQENSPLAGAKIVAISTDKEISKKWSVTGETDENGTATLVTRGKFKGVPAGDYVLIITKDEIEQKEIASTNPNAQEKQYSAPKFFSLIDPKSSDEKTSPHKITVEPKNNTFDIDVGKKVRIEKKMAAA